MMKLRIKLDVWSTGIDEELRVRNCKLLLDAYLRLLPGRVWLYLKKWRSTVLGDPDYHVLTADHIHEHEKYMHGPEDVIAKGT
jgi:hypothetical protein